MWCESPSTASIGTARAVGDTGGGRGIVAACFDERDTFSGQRVRSWSIIMQRAAKTEHSCASYCPAKSVAVPSSAAHHRHLG